MEIFKRNKKVFILLGILVFLFFVFFMLGLLLPKKKPVPTLPPPILQGSPETSQKAEETTVSYYPLAPYNIPKNANFYFEYVGRLKLKVYLIGNKDAAQKEFEDFAKEKGVDLSTHQVTYLSPP